MYSFLLGSRLFLTPHQLLTELHRLATEQNSSEIYWNSSEKVCLKCRQMQTVGAEESSKKSYANESDFCSQSFLSTAYITIGATENTQNEGEDTIHRRRKGRRRNQELETDLNSVPQTNCPASRQSCDSGILSVVLDPFYIDNSNNNVGNTDLLSKKLSLTCNDSGYAVEETTVSCHSCMKKKQREECIQSKTQLVKILREWVQNFPADFRNKKTRWTLDDVIKSCQFDNEVS